MTGKTELEIREMKLLKSEQQGNRCPRCGNILLPGAQLSHKIGQGSRNIAHYERKYSRLWGKGIGRKIIHHPLNTDLTCPGPCNSATSINSKTAIVEDLVMKILEAIKNELTRKNC